MKVIIKTLYEEMYKLTEPECRQCRSPYSCCSPEYCDMAEENLHGHDIPKRNRNNLFLDVHGKCQIAPHHRPLCTLHVCCIHNLGFKRGDESWTKKYFKLRGKICKLEYLGT